jgi:hypothetical protein
MYFLYTEYNPRLDVEGLKTLVLEDENGVRVGQSYVPKRKLEALTKEAMHLASYHRIPVNQIRWKKV